MNPLGYAAWGVRYVHTDRMAYGDRLTDPDAAPGPEPAPVVEDAPAPPPVPEPSPFPTTWVSSVYAELQPGGVPRWKADWAVTDEDGLAEWLALAELTDLTAARGSWEAARTLFASDTPCAGLYATQSPETRLSRVVVPPEAHKPTQPLPTPNPKETNP